MKRWRWWLAGVVGVGAMGVFTAIGAVFCAMTLRGFPRDPRGPAAMAARARLAGVEDVAIPARDGVRLAGWWVPAPRGSDGRRCVLAAHGIGDWRVGSSGFAGLFGEAGYAVLLPDSRAHGTSGGEQVTYGLLERYDVLDWVEWMRGRGCREVYGMGESLGAAVLLQAAAAGPAFRAIAVESAFSDLRSIGEYRTRRVAGLGEWSAKAAVAAGMVFARVRFGLNFAEASPREAGQRARCPVLLIHGMGDLETPAWHSEAIRAASPRAELWLVPGAGHTGAAAAAPAEFRRRVLAWFAAH